jgi:hypothetical protein
MRGAERSDAAGGRSDIDEECRTASRVVARSAESHAGSRAAGVKDGHDGADCRPIPSLVAQGERG